MDINPNAIVNSLIYSLLGVAIFWIAFLILDKLTPYDLWGQIIREKNVALAVVVGALAIAIGLIVAAAIH
jgi:uncharacterized membrane protein YjfL (UPF0719 family)